MRPRSTLVVALRRDRLPREEELVSAFVQACGCDRGTVGRWADVRRGLAIGAVVGEGWTGGESLLRRLPGFPAPRRAGLSVRGRCRWVRRGRVRSCAAGVAAAGVERADGRVVRAVHADAVDGLPGLRGGHAYRGRRCWDVGQAQGRRPGAEAAVVGREVERLIREMFPEDPAGAVALVRCLSNADPLWIGDAQGRRAWGLFQYGDVDLLRSRVTCVRQGPGS